MVVQPFAPKDKVFPTMPLLSKMFIFIIHLVSILIPPNSPPPNHRRFLVSLFPRNLYTIASHSLYMKFGVIPFNWLSCRWFQTGRFILWPSSKIGAISSMTEIRRVVPPSVFTCWDKAFSTIPLVWKSANGY